MNILLDVIATVLLLPFLMFGSNVTIKGKRSTYGSLALTVMVIYILWRVWS